MTRPDQIPLVARVALVVIYPACLVAVMLVGWVWDLCGWVWRRIHLWH